jgi:methyl coenzyme M reductase beta subunit
LRPGLRADVEALIVVASAEPLDAAGMVREAGTSLTETERRSRPVGELFSALAKQKLALRIVVAPYEIREP